MAIYTYTFHDHIPIEFSVDCIWGGWNEWSACTKTCGGGMKKSNRNIKQDPLFGGRKCEGNHTRWMPCNIDPCPGI